MLEESYVLEVLQSYNKTSLLSIRMSTQIELLVVYFEPAFNMLKHLVSLDVTFSLGFTRKAKVHYD